MCKWLNASGDGDPDKIIIKLEVVELNGHSPDNKDPITTFDIAPGLQPTFWVYAPKTRDMSTLNLYESIANPLLRVPSPTIRVEQDDVVWVVLENTHYLPHSIHLHGVIILLWITRKTAMMALVKPATWIPCRVKVRRMSLSHVSLVRCTITAMFNRTLTSLWVCRGCLLLRKIDQTTGLKHLT